MPEPVAQPATNWYARERRHEHIVPTEIGRAGYGYTGKCDAAHERADHDCQKVSLRAKIGPARRNGFVEFSLPLLMSKEL